MVGSSNLPEYMVKFERGRFLSRSRGYNSQFPGGLTNFVTLLVFRDIKSEPGKAHLGPDDPSSREIIAGEISSICSYRKYRSLLIMTFSWCIPTPSSTPSMFSSSRHPSYSFTNSYFHQTGNGCRKSSPSFSGFSYFMHWEAVQLLSSIALQSRHSGWSGWGLKVAHRWILASKCTTVSE